MSHSVTAEQEHAIVLGGSLGGLFTARVLADHFKRVTIIERDPVQDEPESRKGQPQTRHLHGVLEPTQRFIRNYLPGVEQNIIDGGAMVGDFGEFVRWYHFDGYKMQTNLNLRGMTLSRPFLEWHVRRCVTQIPHVTLMSETAALELMTNSDHSRITGVKVLHRANNEETAEVLNADLIVDVCGRGSITPKWLEQIGYQAPLEEEVTVRVGYATRVYRRTPDQLKGAEVLMIASTPPTGKRGAYMFPIEGDRWIVTAGGWSGDHPPADEAGFMEYIRSLPTTELYDILSKAEPLSDIVTYKFPASRRRRYDKLSRFPDGYLALGDAVASFNPIYGQGMSSAAMQAEVLDESLKQSNLEGIWRSFFERTAKVIDLPWQLTVGEDFRFPETEGKRPMGTDLINRYVALVHRATHRDPVVYRQFLNVMHLIAPPTSLMHPQIIWRVMRANFLN